MILSELLSLDIAGKRVLILGRPCAGKTYLSEILFVNPIHTDDYLHLEEENALYHIIEDEACLRGSLKNTTVIEGMLGYNLLLYGAKTQMYKPDIVIEVEISIGKQRELYLKEREPSKLKYLRRFHLLHLEMMNEYHRIVPAEQKPTFITLENNWSYANEKQD